MNWNMMSFLPEAGACQTNFNVSYFEKTKVYLVLNLNKICQTGREMLSEQSNPSLNCLAKNRIVWYT